MSASASVAQPSPPVVGEGPGRRGRAWSWAAGVGALVASVLILLYCATPPWDIARFVLASIWSVLLPGVLVHRLLAGPSPNLLTEITYGFLLGIPLQLVAWATFVTVGAGPWMTVYPVLPLVVFGAVPSLRRHLRPIRYADRLRPWVGCSLALGYLFLLLRLAFSTFLRSPLPPGTGRWYQDLYWHLAISAEAMHAAPPQVPQVAGDLLRYHWFSNAHMAALALVSHVDVLVVVIRLWYLPILAATVAATYLLTVRLSGSPVAGVLAMTLVVIPTSLQPVLWVGATASNAVTGLSPSEDLGVPLTLLAVGVLVEAVRGRLSGRGWILLALTLGACSGAKSSILPTLVCGVLLALLVNLVRHSNRVTSLKVAALTLGILVTTAPFLAGGSAASRLGLADGIRLQASYRGLDRLIRSGAGPGHSWLILLLVLLVVGVLLQKGTALTLLGLSRDERRDPATWLLVGCLAGGFGALVLIDHPSQSQVYFLTGLLPLWVTLTAWGLAALLAQWRRVRPARHPLAILLLGAAAGLLLLRLAHLAGGAHGGTPTAVVRLALVLGGVAALVAAVVVGSTVLRRRGQIRLAATLALGAATALVAAALVPSALDAVHTLSPISGLPPTAARLRPAQVAAATWVRRHTPASDLIATNVHCTVGRTRPHCDSRAYWVTGLTERQAYVESWAYTDQAQANHGKDGYRYTKQPFYNQPRLRMNDLAFTAPTPADLATLYRAGVRWLVADSGAGPVSSRLHQLAILRFQEGGTAVYQLRPAQ